MFSSTVLNEYPVSIHASSREDATSRKTQAQYPFQFKYTRPRGWPPQSPPLEQPFNGVSIHASSREDATVILPLHVRVIKFQSTRPRGRTRLLDVLI